EDLPEEGREGVGDVARGDRGQFADCAGGVGRGRRRLLSGHDPTVWCTVAACHPRPRSPTAGDDGAHAPSAARSTPAMSILTIVNMASMARLARPGSGSLSSSCSRVGTTCQDSPYRSV